MSTPVDWATKLLSGECRSLPHGTTYKKLFACPDCIPSDRPTHLITDGSHWTEWVSIGVTASSGDGLAIGAVAKEVRGPINASHFAELWGIAVCWEAQMAAPSGIRHIGTDVSDYANALLSPKAKSEHAKLIRSLESPHAYDRAVDVYGKWYVDVLELAAQAIQKANLYTPPKTHLFPHNQCHLVAARMRDFRANVDERSVRPNVATPTPPLASNPESAKPSMKEWMARDKPHLAILRPTEDRITTNPKAHPITHPVPEKKPKIRKNKTHVNSLQTWAPKEVLANPKPPKTAAPAPWQYKDIPDGYGVISTADGYKLVRVQVIGTMAERKPVTAESLAAATIDVLSGPPERNVYNAMERARKAIASP